MQVGKTFQQVPSDCASDGDLLEQILSKMGGRPHPRGLAPWCLLTLTSVSSRSGPGAFFQSALLHTPTGVLSRCEENQLCARRPSQLSSESL